MMADDVTACPECNDADVRERPTRPGPIRWHCAGCGARFPTPVERPSQKARGKFNLPTAGGGD